MNFIPAKCPSCGGDLQIPDERDFVNCMYCQSLIKVREAIILKSDINTVNLMEIAYEGIRQRNYGEAIEYINKVLEIDVRHRLAWWGKAVISINSSDGDLHKMNEGLAYSLKAYNLSDEKEKAEIKEKMISEIIEHDLWIEHADFLFEVFETYGADDERILLKIIDMTQKTINEEIVSGGSDLILHLEQQEKALDYFENINKEKFDILKDKADREINNAYRIRKRELNTIRFHSIIALFMKSAIVIVPAILILSFLLSISNQKVDTTSFYLYMVFLFLGYLLLIYSIIYMKVAKYEKGKFGENIYFRDFNL